jgi:hypothetical protein
VLVGIERSELASRVSRRAERSRASSNSSEVPAPDAGDDTPADRAALVKRILSIKLFDSAVDTNGNGTGDAEGGKQARGGAWKRSVAELEGEILCGESDRHRGLGMNARQRARGEHVAPPSSAGSDPLTRSLPVHPLCAIQRQQARFPREHGECRTCGGRASASCAFPCGLAAAREGGPLSPLPA